MPSQSSEASRLLGERLRQARIETRATQAEVAHLADLNVSNYGRIERGHGNPNFDTIVRLAGVLGVDPGILVRDIRIDQLPPTRQSYTVDEFRRERERKTH